MADSCNSLEPVANSGDCNGCSSQDSTSDDTVDPRVQIELERLNAATDLINKLEIELDEARSNFRLLLSESSNRVNHLAKKLGNCVEKARPYYEARMRAKQLQSRTQKAALRYERATSAHVAAKEMVHLAEEGLKNEGTCFDPAWQEMLNHATMKVNEAESERLLSKHDHQHTSLSYNEAERIVQQLHQELKKSITKSSLSTRRGLLQLNNLANQHQLQFLPYFEMKAQFNQVLEEQRQKIHKLEENVMKVKISYADALHNLETISDEIHQRRDLEDRSTTPDSDCGNGDSRDPLLQNSKNMEPFAEIFANCSIGDTYKSLPRQLSSKSAVIPKCVIDKHEKNFQWTLPRNFSLLRQDFGIPNDHGSAQSSTNAAAASLGEGLTNGTGHSHVTETVEKQVSSASLVKDSGHYEMRTGDNQTFSRSPEMMDSLNDPRFHSVDLNLRLRIPKESDSESLASNDTADTLDETQIECLLLEQALPNDELMGPDSPENADLVNRYDN